MTNQIADNERAYLQKLIARAGQAEAALLAAQKAKAALECYVADLAELYQCSPKDALNAETGVITRAASEDVEHG